ncbi:MAG: PAS domain S-box protein [Verrucomicrobiae bacterium]|nr:PAS domain S-box protein [Verrucomicrobiae bacterium]
MRALDHSILRHDYAADGTVLSVNERFCAVTGYAADEIIGQTHSKLDPNTESPRCWTQRHGDVVAGGLRAGETSIVAKDGRQLWLDSTIAAVYDNAGGLIGYTCLSTDITSAVLARDELRRNGKLMQLGQLTATVAHEIRNPLGAIRTASFVLERKVRSHVDGVGAQLDRINAGIQRCDKIITELLDFSRAKVLLRQQLAVDGWLVKTIAEDCSSLQGNPAICYKLGLGDHEASFDPDQMRQVLVNLLSNAAEAMADKAKADKAYSPVLTVSTRLNGELVEIAVSDNGPGIQPSNLARIREPLFTTKSFGVGLGISAIERILENHAGYLAISSAYGSGATFVAGFERGPVIAKNAEAA